MQLSINMAVSMDGKIATKRRGPVKLGSGYDSQRMAEIRAEHDAVINGASTFRAHPYLLHVDDPELVRRRLAAGKSAQPISAISSSRLDIPRNTPFEKARGAERWAFCGSRAPKKTIASLEKSGIRVFQARSLRPEPAFILKNFEKAGVQRLLLEGGGEFNAAFLEKDLVHTIYLTLCPVLIGGADSPSFFEGRGFSAEFPRFALKECRQLGDELYLRYERINAPR